VTPAISVIVPARDAAATIGLALRSTLRALPDDARVFVRSDGSTDETASRVRAVGDRRVTLVDGDSSIGVAASLNQLLDLVETPLVARMDADDVTLPRRFRRQVPRVLGGGDDIVFSTTVSWFPDRAPHRRLRPPRPFAVSAAAAPVLLLLENGFSHPTMTARTEVLRSLGGYRPLPSEDFDLWVRAALGGVRLSRLAEPGLLWRRHDGQVTRDPAWEAARLADDRCITALEELAARQLGSVPGLLRWRRAGFPAASRPPGVADELAAIGDLARGLGPSDRLAVGSRLRTLRGHVDRARGEEAA
jgi:hypothetical protein